MTTALRFLCFALLLLPQFSHAAPKKNLLQLGNAFPEFQLATPTATSDREYLQLSGESFTPSQIKAELLVVELLNVHCPHCQMQTPAYNELHKLIEANPATRGKIKMLAFAVGNLDAEVQTFKNRYQVAFPLLADPSFIAWRAVGGTATPFTIYVRQDKPGQPGIITGTHTGMNTDYRQLFARLSAMTETTAAEFRSKAQAVAAQQSRVEPILTELQLEYKVRTAFTRFGRIDNFTKLSLQSGRQVYSGQIRRDNQRERLFAEVASRTSVCDICHDVHFIYLFDRSARVIGFEPLQLTKYGNIHWSDLEVDTMRQRVVGKYLTMPKPFDPSIDAISSATMTSALVFDSLAQGEELIAELSAQGLM